MSAILPSHKCLGVPYKCRRVRGRISAMERVMNAVEVIGGACLTLGLLALVWLAGAGAAYVW